MTDYPTYGAPPEPMTEAEVETYVRGALKAAGLVGVPESDIEQFISIYPGVRELTGWVHAQAFPEESSVIYDPLTPYGLGMVAAEVHPGE